MKKVLKKFNRTLAIMLAAAMVLTMVPQTAMPVLAAPEAVEGEDAGNDTSDIIPTSNDSQDTSDEDGESDSENTEDEVTPSDSSDEGGSQSTEKTEDVTEADETDNSGVSESTEGETTPEEGDVTEENPVDNDTPVIDEPVGEESDEENAVTDSEINAIENTDTTIDVSFVNDPDTDTAENTAEVVFLSGCVSSNKKLAKDRDLEFRVEPAAGRSLVKVEVKTVDGETEATVSATETSGVYTVSKSSFIKGSGETATALNGKIIVTTKAVNYKVSFAGADDGVANSYEIYTVEPKSETDTTKVLGTKVADGAKTDIAYDASKEFALVVTADANKFDSLTLDGEDVETAEAELNKKSDAANAEKTKCVTFTVEPTKYDGLKDTTTDNTEAVVSVKVVAKAKLTVASFDSENANSTVAASDTNTAATFINYDGTKFGTDSTFVEGADDLAKSLAFKVTPAANYKVTDVTAKATTAANEEGTDVNVAKADASTTDGSVECTIDLSQEALKGFSVDTVLTISIATALDDTKDTVHTINFKNKDGKAPEHVNIWHGEDYAELDGDSLSVAGDTYVIQVAPEAGYELAKGSKTEGADKNDDKYVVTLRENRVYTGITDSVTISTEVEAYDADADCSNEIILTLKDEYGDKQYKDNPTETDEAKPYVVKSVDVVIDTNIKKNNNEKIVYVDNALGKEATYQLEGTGILHDDEAEDSENTWVIPKSLDEITVKVTSAKENYLSLNDGSYEWKPTVEGNVSTYTIPVSVMSSEMVNTLTICDVSEMEYASVFVKAVPDDINVRGRHLQYVNSYYGITLNGEPDKDGYYTVNYPGASIDYPYDATKIPVGKEVALTFEPKEGTEITKVTYTMGDEEAKEATLDRTGKCTLQLTLTGDLRIAVESKSDYRVKLTSDEGLNWNGEAYVADYTDTNINIGLTKAGVDYTNALYDVVVKDGASTAATKAEVNGATATIASIAESEYGKDLTIEVYINKDTKYTATLKTNVVSKEVTVTRTVNGKATTVAEDSTVEIMPDAAMTFKVAPAAGASLNDLDVEILTKEGAAFAKESDPIEDSYFKDGTLYIQTKPGAVKDTEALVSIYNVNAKTADNKDDKTPLKGGKFVLKLTDPLVKTAEIKSVTAVAGSGTNREVRLNVNVDFKDKKNLPVAPVQGDLYYKVELTAPTGAPEGVEVIGDKELVRYEKIEKDDEGNFENPAKPLTIPLVVKNSADKEGFVADIAEVISTTAKVTLVQSKVGEPTKDDDYIAGPEAVMRDNTLSTKAPIYETKLSVKNVNGATVFTGQSDVKVATPVFGKTTAYDTIYTEFVDTKTGVLYGSSFGGEYDNYFDTYVGSDNSIMVSVSKNVKVNSGTYKNMLKTLGVKVTAVAPDESYAASAVVKLKFKQGIYSVSVDESKAKLPKTIFKDTNKAASVKITPLLNGGSKDYKPAKSTVTWEIDRADDNDSAYAAAALAGNKPLVSVKNGTVSITRDYQVQPEESDNKFTVTIRANDFDGNGYEYSTYTTKTFEITDEKNEIGKLVVLDYEGNVKDPATLTAEDFDYWNHKYDNGSSDSTKYLYVAALKKSAKDADWYDRGGDDILPVTFKSGNAKALAVNTANGLLTFSKPADRIKITATTVDGGKAAKAELVINVKPYKQIGLSIEGVDSKTGLGETDIHYSGGNNEMYQLYPHYYTGDDEKPWNGISDYKNLKITVKGGKFIANKNWAKVRGNRMGYAVVVTDKSGKATITITDTANKDKSTNHKDYTITNDSNKVSVKAPSIKLYDPKKVTASTEKITWQVTDKNNDNYAGSYVKLTPDFTVTTSNPAYNIVGQKGKILKIDENGRFALDTYYLYGGAYKMVATVGTMVGGEFVAAAKDVKLSFSIPAKKYKTTLNVKGAYTLDAKSASRAVIDVKSDYAYEISDAMNVIKKVQGKDDHTNRFTDYFEVGGYWNENDEYVYTIGLRTGLSAEQLAYITSREGKDDCTGYITVTNYYYEDVYDEWGDWVDERKVELNTKDVQVKISFKENKYSLTSATIFSNGTATTPVKATVKLMNGKLHDYAAIVAVDAADDGKFAAATNAISFNDDGDIVITSKTAAIASGKYNVKLIVVPQDSSFVRWDREAKKWVPVNDKTENGAALTEADLIAKAGIPVTAKIDVKAVDTKKITKAKNLNIALTAKDYVQKDDEDKYYGKYVVDVPYTLSADGADIASVAVNLKDRAGVDKNEVGADKEKLVVAEKTVAWDEDENETNVIRLHVSKKALVALTDMAKADKPITGYGKKLKVPVEIKYTNGITTTDTLNFNITMPKNKPMDFAAVQKNLEDNKAAIEKIQTRLGGDAEWVLTDLIELVNEKVVNLVPADTDVAVNYELERKYLNDGEEVKDADMGKTPKYDEIMTAGKAKITLTLTDVSKTADNIKDVSWNYTLGMDVRYDDIDLAFNEIYNLDLTYTNATTKESLLAEIKAADSMKPYLDTRKGHLSLKVRGFEKKEATTKDEGYISAEILVKDLVTGETGNEWIYGTIARLMTISEAKAEVRELIDDEAEVLKFWNDNFWNEDNTKAAVIAAAQEVINNENIVPTISEWNYVAPKQPDANGKTDEEKAGKDGSLQFTVVLTKTQADGTRTAEITSAKATISKEDDRRRNALIKVIDTYIGKSAEMEGITEAKFDSTKNEFTVVINASAAKTKVRDDFEAWAEKMDKDEELKNKIKEDLENAFADDWDNVKSVTLDATMYALKETEHKDTTIVKQTDETISQFADRMYAKMKANQKEYLDKLEKKILDRVGNEELNYAFLIAANPTGSLKVTVDWKDGTQSSQSSTIKVQ